MQFIKCFVEIMHLDKASPVLWLHLGPLPLSNSATYTLLQPAAVPFPMAPSFAKRGRLGNTKEISCCVYSSRVLVRCRSQFQPVMGKGSKLQ